MAWTSDRRDGDTRRPVPADLAGTRDGLERMRALLGMALDRLSANADDRKGPVRPGGPEAAVTAAREVLRGRLLPEEGADTAEWLSVLFDGYAQGAVDLTHPAAVSRMQCPPTVAAATAELVAAVLNQSLHAWESGPFALELERELVAELAALVGYGPDAAGTLTPGGSVSNLMGMLLARDHAAYGIAEGVSERGLSGTSRHPRVLCSESAHFSVARGAGFVGMGRDSVIPVAVDDTGRLDVREARRILDRLAGDEVPVALVATAGTTDFGVFDPLPEIADLCSSRDMWLHVDAAYGIGALFSQRLRSLLEGLDRADSIAFDTHKFGWTPASSSFLLVRDRRHMEPLTQQAVYLNPADDEDAGFTSLLGTSMQTTRRVDALKIAAAFGVLGRRGLETWVDRCHALARYAADRLAADERYELARSPILTTVVFRHRGGDDPDAFNAELRRRLMSDGEVLVARTNVRGADGGSAVYLKLIFLNPTTRDADVDALLDGISAGADALASG